MKAARLAEIRAGLSGGFGPLPWKDGDPRCHCTQCSRCGELFRTQDYPAHRDVCWVGSGKSTIVELLAEVERLTATLAKVTTVVDGLPATLATTGGGTYTDVRLSDLQAELHAARQR
jgi:hypothetical protein